MRGACGGGGESEEGGHEDVERGVCGGSAPGRMWQSRHWGGACVARWRFGEFCEHYATAAAGFNWDALLQPSQEEKRRRAAAAEEEDEDEDRQSGAEFLG